MRLPVATACVLALLSGGCARSAKEQSQVRMVEATIDGITCPSCVPPLTASLRREFAEPTEIEVDDDRDTATLRLKPGQTFSPDAFQRAVRDVRMRIVEVRVEACGRLESKGAERWLVAGTSRFLVEGDRGIPMNQSLCINGRLDTSGPSPTLAVKSFELQNGARSGT